MEIISNVAQVATVATEAAVETVKSGNIAMQYADKAISVAKGHPMAAGLVGGIAVAGAAYGTWKLAKRFLKRHSK